MKSHCFPPIAGVDARVLILGSLPGVESLRQQQYYAQKHNAFWKIIERLYGISHGDTFEARKNQLIEKKVAVWDVCAAAVREGSLDSAIDAASIVPNDFAGFYAKHPHIKLVCFNGKKAEDIYRRKVLPNLPPNDLRYVSLPSTSPAHAGMNLEAKLSCWQKALQEII